jgi:hypothetical protein
MLARLGCLGELRSEPAHPPVDSDVINVDAALGQQFFNVPVGQAIRNTAGLERDHLKRQPEASKDRDRGAESRDRSPPLAIDQRNGTVKPQVMLPAASYRAVQGLGVR